MSQDALGQLKHLKTARARWPFPDVIRFCCCCCNICSIMSSRRVLVIIIETAASGAEIVGARAVISRAAGIVVDVSD